MKNHLYFQGNINPSNIFEVAAIMYNILKDKRFTMVENLGGNHTNVRVHQYLENRGNESCLISPWISDDGKVCVINWYDNYGVGTLYMEEFLSMDEKEIRAEGKNYDDQWYEKVLVIE